MITNPFFQDTNWQTAGANDPRGPGNQQPADWTLTVTPAGALMPWPEKNARNEAGQSISVEARAGGPGEYVHKLAGQLPDNEQAAQPRALLVLPNTDKVYKGFGGVAHAFTLSQKLTSPPGTKKQYLLYVLAETTDTPTPPHTDLEPDHFRVRFAVGGDTVESHYADMKGHRVIPGNERAWNILGISSFEFPASGEAQMVITCQKNWPGLVDFFIAGVTEEMIGFPPPPPGDGGEPTDELAVLTQLATSFDLDTNLQRSITARMEHTRDAMLTEMVRLRNLPR